MTINTQSTLFTMKHSYISYYITCFTIFQKEILLFYYSDWWSFLILVKLEIVTALKVNRV